MATSQIKNKNEFQALVLKSANDYPLSFIETGNDDYKGLNVKDKNNTIRYELLFGDGKLIFRAYDASGAAIKDVVIA